MKNQLPTKRKPELLAPAGNFEGLIGCINAGADAVYLGGNRFGARAYADNFTDEEIVKAIKYAHLFGVKVYLTINTLIKEREFQDALEFVRPFCEAGLDAFIVQDIGLSKALLERYPMTEVHTSTQGFVTGIMAAEYYKNLGATRVVLAREMTLEEIKEIKANVDVELETFIHGAMCYSYSGECLFSSSFGGRSGNRGRCAGPCRQPYTSLFDNKKYEDQYILSMKDQCTVSLLPQIIEAGVDSLKIEGRMKKPEYTAFVTSIYRKYIDLYYSNEPYVVSKKDLNNLTSIYLRSQIGCGYYEKTKAPDMISLSSPAYNGADDSLMEEIRKRFLTTEKKAKISGYFYASVGNPVILTLIFGDKSVTVSGNDCEPAQKKATTIEEIAKSLRKLGNTPFEYENLSIDCDSDVFLPVSVLNDLRRRAVEELLNEI